MESRTIEDYIPRLMNEFPYLTEDDIRNSLKFGFKRYTKAKSLGCDVMISDNAVYKILAFTGFLTSNSLIHYNTSLRKRRAKRRYFYDINKRKWDGTYYLGIRSKKVQKVKDFIQNENKTELKLGKTILYMFEEDVEENSVYKILCRVTYPRYRYFSLYESNYILNKKQIIKMEYINYE